MAANWKNIRLNFMQKYIIDGEEPIEYMVRICYDKLSAMDIYLSRNALLKIIDRFLGEKLSAADLEAFAEALDGNESVRFEEQYRQALSDVLFQLSTPEINAPLTMASVTSIRSLLARDSNTCSSE
jgi:hypothetical protein